MSKKRRFPSLGSVLIGDELGLLKKIDIHSTPSTSNVITLNRETLSSEPSPDKSILSIRPFKNFSFESEHEIDDDSEHGELDDRDPRTRVVFDWKLNNESSILFLVASKPSKLQIYNSLTNQLSDVKCVQSNLNLIGGEPINRNHIVVCYENGTIDVQNVDKTLLESSSETKKKAIRLLGLDLNEENEDHSPKSCKSSASSSGKKSANLSAKSKSSTGTSSSSETASSLSHSTASNVFSPNWSCTSTSLACFKVCGNRVAVAGKNLDLKVFDLTTKQCTFTAKTSNKDWLGLKSPVWVSDLDWIGPVPKLSSTPSMIATCSRTDPFVRIYDLKSKQRKPVMSLNFKDSTFNNDSNPPSFTAICSTLTPQSVSLPTQQLILGTTMGRMMAVDLRFNSHSYRHLGVFKSFGGGAIRDIKFVPQTSTHSKIISCSLDRFVRIHSFAMGADKTRLLDSKFYIKTKPVCIQPICTNFVFANVSDDVAHIDDSEDSDN
ncbi:hypothetical protein B4U79_06164 [Dinothrombium tinctorium]|uniref:Uncharacterized protein n=1 Tax=Dinothrombium tinctorium TaxID=1965070 RepID=A0A3S3PF42_9ACAR|nr:hypothetical protein B4U79_00542 [Dinothrombium tinctorium]RWS13466.1 hypothetical protein B4U79_03306 [Dinothrombium tinctorium]RWS13986.1 hypothetical protein B4U79_11626 [Dinothrombium tinctorium]RWS13990.1 hypothetical protein B4U79_06164 [Dinothrombium tinctorium]